MKENKKLLIQLFGAEPDDVEETAVETEDEDVEFEDGATEEETETETETTEEKVEEKTTEKENTTKKENTNAINARKRIEEKQRKREEELKRQAKLDTLKKISGGVNKFTGEKILDEEDIEEYEIMLELEAQNKDVLEDFPKYIKERKRQARLEEEKAKESERLAEQQTQKDLDEFIEKYDRETAEKIFENEAFLEFSNELIGTVPLTTIYELFDKTNKKIQDEIENQLIKKEARKKASPGVPGSKSVKEKSVLDMDDKEFHDFQMRLLSGNY